MNAIIPLLQKKGNKTDLNNYRGISLLSVPYKIISKVLFNGIKLIIENELGKYQNVFRSRRSYAE